MKFFITVLITFLSALCFSQDSSISAEELFFYNQPSARTEAMGKSGIAVSDGIYSVFHNPALLTRFEKMSLSLSQSSPYDRYADSEQSFAGIGFSPKSTFSAGLFMNSLDYGEKVDFWDQDSTAVISSYEPFVKNYGLAISLRPSRFFTIGIGGNFYEMNAFDGEKEQSRTAFSLDLGIHSIVNVSTTSKLRQRSSVGVGLKNIYGQELDGKELPTILSGGIEYSMIPMVRNPFTNTLWAMLFTLTGEYRHCTNADYSRFSGGMEALFSEVIAFRFGYYSQETSTKINDTQEFTYGFGLYLPLYRFEDAGIPFNISLDYVKLPVPKRSDDPVYDGDYNNYSLTISWMRRRD